MERAVVSDGSHAVLFILKEFVFLPLGDFRTGCGGRLAPRDLDPAATVPIPTGTSTPAGAVSATHVLGENLKGSLGCSMQHFRDGGVYT